MEKTNLLLDAKYAARFYSKINCPSNPDACNIWLAGTNGRGYGVFHIKRKPCRAHRISYAQHYGEFDKKLCVLHRCDTPNCCNPRHLFLGTPADNSADMKVKGRSSRGEKNPAAKLIQSQVVQIRMLLKEGNLIQKEIAKIFGVSRQNISKINTGKLW